MFLSAYHLALNSDSLKQESDLLGFYTSNWKPQGIPPRKVVEKKVSIFSENYEGIMGVTTDVKHCMEEVVRFMILNWPVNSSGKNSLAADIKLIR